VLPAWDVACAYQAAFAIVAAVDRRRRTGQGAPLRIALSDMAFTTLSHIGLVAEAEILRRNRPVIGNYIYGAFGRDFTSADGQRVMVAAISSAQWQGLVKACQKEAEVAQLERSLGLDFQDEGQRFEARERIAALFEPWFVAHRLNEIREEFDRQRVCWGLYRSTQDLVDHDPRVSLANPVWQQIETPGVGSHLAAGSAVRVQGEKRRDVIPAPLLGQHTDEVLLDVLGLSSANVGQLHDQGVVAGPG
jgi:2-methylfumaryl-CoA isomerase